MSVKTTLKPKQRVAIQPIAAGSSFQDTATLAGITIRTLHRWRNDPAFVAGMQAADADNLAGLARKMAGASDQALDLMVEIVVDKSAPLSVRLRAASAILQYRAEFFSALNMSERITALENRLDQREGERQGNEHD